MGDFCVSGFHSNLPIHHKNKVIAIICRVINKSPGNYPCHLDGHLFPIAMPIIGQMGDYGTLECWEESETIKLLQNYTGLKIVEIFEQISSCSKWKKPDEFPEVFKMFDKCCRYQTNTVKQHRYVIIYEHYSIYKKMTYEMEDVRKWLNESANIMELFYKEFPNFVLKDFKNVDAYPNIFTSYTIRNFYSDLCFNNNFLKKQSKNLEDAFQKYRQLTPPHIMPNIQDDGFMSLYYMGKYSIDNKFINEAIDWISFVYTLDYVGGHFYYSVSAGQSWHHDKAYIDYRKELLQEMLNVINSLNESSDESDYIDDEYDEDDTDTAFNENSFYENDDILADFNFIESDDILHFDL